MQGSQNSVADYGQVYNEVLEYANDLFRVISQTGGPFAHSPVENVSQQDLTNLAHSVTGMLLHMNWAEIAGEKLPDRSNTIKGKILEALGVFLKMKMKAIDDLIPNVCHDCVQMRTNQVIQCFQRRMTESYQKSGNNQEGGRNDDQKKQDLAQFLFTLWIDVQYQGQPHPAAEMHTIGSILVGAIVNQYYNSQSQESAESTIDGSNNSSNANSASSSQEEFPFSTPQEVLSVMACKLNDLTSQLIRLSMELYHRTGYMPIEVSRPKMASFFQYYTIDTTQSEMSSSLLSSHTTADDPEYVRSPFSIQLVDSFAALLELLRKVENLKQKVIAVDFEGVKLCRNGALCLIQMTLSDDPSIVYVIDIYLLTQIAMSGVCTARGTTLKSVLESNEVEKVWFDPRNDSDALYHQFGVAASHIFDLQLAEVASRRSQGLNVGFVQGLNKVLMSCPALDPTQKKFSEHIGNLGKNLFEPACGGDYTIFQKRPLDPQILVYSAHDARYMLELRSTLIENIKDFDAWRPRIFDASQARANWCMNAEYYIPNSEAPMF